MTPIPPPVRAPSFTAPRIARSMAHGDATRTDCPVRAAAASNFVRTERHCTAQADLASGEVVRAVAIPVVPEGKRPPSTGIRRPRLMHRATRFG